MLKYRTPGVYREEIFPTLAAELRTGVPALLGFTGDKLLFSLASGFQSDLDNKVISEDLRQAFEAGGRPLSQGATISIEIEGARWRITDQEFEQTYLITNEVDLAVYASVPVNTPQMLTLWSQFKEHFGVQEVRGEALSDGYLAYAVRGFFENGGHLCYVVRLDEELSPVEALREGLEALACLDAIDLVCAPDIMTHVNDADVQTMQTDVLDHCQALGNRFAILDALPSANPDQVLSQRRALDGSRRALDGSNGALYYPWSQVADGPVLTDSFVPPCGHVAGVFARSDRRVGVHKAPANEILEGVLDLEVNLTDAQQGSLNPEGVNCLRAFPGRGIRVWGARTLSGDLPWIYVNVRRLFLTAGRWIEREMAGVVFEPHDTRLWARIGRELTAYFNDLFQRGALKGRTAQEAFYVKCDAETNPPEVRDAGMVVTEIGLAPAVPSEFVVVRIIHGASGLTIAGPTRPD